MLAPSLESHGFRLSQPKTGNGSGGRFAEVRWTRGEQYLELHVRYALGLVTYGLDGEAFSHADYMRWRQIRGQYPGYSTDPIDGFRHLAADLNGAAGQRRRSAQVRAGKSWSVQASPSLAASDLAPPRLIARESRSDPCCVGRRWPHANAVFANAVFANGS